MVEGRAAIVREEIRRKKGGQQAALVICIALGVSGGRTNSFRAVRRDWRAERRAGRCPSKTGSARANSAAHGLAAEIGGRAYALGNSVLWRVDALRTGGEIERGLWRSLGCGGGFSGDDDFDDRQRHGGSSIDDGGTPNCKAHGGNSKQRRTHRRRRHACKNCSAGPVPRTEKKRRTQ